jgi:co-chaperonin GroES (HSP10)
MIPILNKVIIKRIQHTSDSGLILSENAYESSIGEVLKAGPGTPADPITVSAGDRVLYEPHTDVDVEVDGEVCTVIPWQSIIAVI